MSEFKEKIKHIYNLKLDRNPQVPKKSFKAVKLPSSVDLRSKCPQVYDQGSLGSCTSNAICGAFSFDDPLYQPSRLFHYYCERSLDGDIPEDAGSTLTQGVNAAAKFGICQEITWPYVINNFTLQPNQTCYDEAKKHYVISSEHVEQSEDSIKGCLSSGFPIVLGILIYESFESDAVAKNGQVPMPSTTEKELGGHAVCIVGYTSDSFIMRNSWGTSWGDKGYFYLPYAYILSPQLTSDLWKITSVATTPDEKTTSICGCFSK